MGYENLTYDQLCEAVQALWPNVIDVDYFLTRLTHGQIVAIVDHCQRMLAPIR